MYLLRLMIPTEDLTDVALIGEDTDDHNDYNHRESCLAMKKQSRHKNNQNIKNDWYRRAVIIEEVPTRVA